MSAPARGLGRAFARMKATVRLLRTAPALIDPGFYSRHNGLDWLVGRPRSLARAHFLLRGQWLGLDPTPVLSTAFARDRLHAGSVPQRGSTWTTLLISPAASTTRIHPLQMPESLGLEGLGERPRAPLARLAEGDRADRARRVFHPLLPDGVRVGAPELAGLYERIAKSRVARGEPPARDVDVLFVNGDRHCPSCTQYRVLNPLAALRGAGVDVAAIDAEDVHNLAGTRLRARLVVVFRALWSEELADAISAWRRDGSRIVFDADDLLFDGPRVMTSLQPGAGPHERLDTDPGRAAGRESMRRVAMLADTACFPTRSLAAAWQTTAGSSSSEVFESFLSSEQLGVADRVVAANEGRGESMVIGYSSGSATHGGDFATAAPGLARVLVRNPRARLRIFGTLALEEFPELAPLRDRIEHDPTLTPRWDELMRRMVSCDVNIVPLELDNGYCRAKSEVKYLEAGAVGVPTVAAAVPAYRRAIGDGERGVLVAEATRWEDALERVVADPVAARRLGHAARDDVRRRYSSNGEVGWRYIGRVADWLEDAGAEAPGSEPLEELYSPRVEPVDPDGPVVICVGTSEPGEIDPAAVRRAASARAPNRAILAAAASEEAFPLAQQIVDHPWYPGCSEADLATALRRAAQITSVGDIEALSTRLRAAGIVPDAAPLAD